MRRRYRSFAATEQLDYINLIVQKIEENAVIAARMGHDDVFAELTLFIRDNLIFQCLNRSIDTYNQVIRIPTKIYGLLSGEYRRKLIEFLIIRFSENISFANISTEIPREYSKSTYLGLISLIKKTLEEENADNFNLLIAKLKETMFSLDDNREIEYSYSFSFTILFWIYYLYDSNKIEISSYNFLLLQQRFEHQYDSVEEVVNRFFHFTEEVESGLWEIQDWDIRTYPSGEAHFVLMPSTWLYFGFTLMLLKFSLLNYQYDFSKILIRRIHGFAKDTILKNLDLVYAHKEKWFSYLYPNQNHADQESAFSYSKERILDFFNILKKEEEIRNYIEIAKIPLSVSKIEEFVKNAGASWHGSAIIPQILKHYGRVTYLPNIFEKKGIGFFTTLLKSRFAFIDGEKYQNIYGLSDFGSRTARTVNNDFFNSLFKIQDASIVAKNELKNELDSFLNAAKDKSAILIFSTWNVIDHLNSDRKEIEYSSNSEIPFSKMEYKGIPIITTYEFKEYLFVVDVNTVQYNIYTKEGWYNNELLVEITEAMKDDVGQKSKKVEEWRGRDGIIYSDEEIDVLESNAVNLKIIFKYDLIFKNNDGIKIIKVIS